MSLVEIDKMFDDLGELRECFLIIFTRSFHIWLASITFQKRLPTMRMMTLSALPCYTSLIQQAGQKKQFLQSYSKKDLGLKNFQKW